MDNKKYIVYLQCLLIFSNLFLNSKLIADSSENSSIKTNLSITKQNQIDTSKAIPITKDSFICLNEMHPIRGFFVTNIIGNIKDTITAAMKTDGAQYPPGSVVQLIPTEVMVKHHKGWNFATKDWEFFELEVSEQGSQIKVRGTTDVINKFGGNCFECHQKAKPQWDLICEDNHGCDSLPIPSFIISMIQNNDPRCD